MKYSLVTMVLIPLIASGGMTITTNEQVSAMLKPDVLQGSLSFEEQSKNANTIKEHLNAIIAEVKRSDPKGEYCHGGGYQLSPRYSYKDQKQEFIGYSGSLYFGCEFYTVEHYNTLIAGVDKVSAPSVRKTQGALSWGVSEKSQASVRQGLRLTLLRTAKMQAEAFS
ncbi:MAG: SIMPL domain-containing protein, partial [Sulfuricurvum sp.]|nr:SIMPL domain-containing protein [Sulfuricurvum sp.]